MGISAAVLAIAAAGFTGCRRYKLKRELINAFQEGDDHYSRFPLKVILLVLLSPIGIKLACSLLTDAPHICSGDG